MASKTVVVAECDRCPRKNRSARTVRFTWEGREYELELCEQHADMLDRELSGWARLAREIERPAPFAAVMSATKERELDRAARHLVERDKKAAALKVPTGFVPPPDGTVAIVRKPPHWDHWTITKHAAEQMEERDITENEVRWCAAAPHVSIPPDDDAPEDKKDEWVYRRGDVICIVNPSDRVVITVLHRERHLVGPREWNVDAV